MILITSFTTSSTYAFVFSEYELGFALYPFILTKVTESTALSMLFFSVIIINGLDTLTIYAQTVVGSIMEKLVHCGIGRTRMVRWMVQLAVCVVLSSVGLVFTTQVKILCSFSQRLLFSPNGALFSEYCSFSPNIALFPKNEYNYIYVHWCLRINKHQL